MGDSEDRLLPPPRDYSQTSVVDWGRQSRQAPMPAASRPIATNSSRTPTNQAQSQRNRQVATATITSGASALERLIQNVVSGQGASASHVIPPEALQEVTVPLQLEWGLPGSDQIQTDGINSWINQVRNAYVGGHAGALADSCASMANNAKLLCIGTMDMMRASLETYKTDLISCQTELKKLNRD